MKKPDFQSPRGRKGFSARPQMKITTKKIRMASRAIECCIFDFARKDGVRRLQL